MLLNQAKDTVDLASAHAVALRQFDTRLKPASDSSERLLDSAEFQLVLHT